MASLDPDHTFSDASCGAYLNFSSYGEIAPAGLNQADNHPLTFFGARQDLLRVACKSAVVFAQLVIHEALAAAYRLDGNNLTSSILRELCASPLCRYASRAIHRVLHLVILQVASK